ncbi:hypothetical protein NMG60_11025851 [Bertholletia excelsa]
MALLSSTLFPHPITHFPDANPDRILSLNLNTGFALIHFPKPRFLPHRIQRLSATISRNRGEQILNSFSSRPPLLLPSPDSLRHLAASAIVLFLGLGFRVFSATASTHLPGLPVATSRTVIEELRIQDNHDIENSGTVENIEDKELKAAFEKWKSKTYALTVPLRIVALRGSIPPSWIKEFIQSQGRRVRLRSEYRGSLDDIFSDLCKSFMKGSLDFKSVMAADIVTVGDSWLNFVIKKGLIEPLQGVEDYDWFKSLSNKWKTYLCRNYEGNIDPEGKIWAVPYRWGSMVIAYKKTKFEKHKLDPIEDWADLWRPELAGKIAMVDSPREVIGAVLKCMGASYNTNNIDTQVAGGRYAVQQKLAQLEKQVRLFDSMHYLKAFGVGDVWVAVGWSSDILPAAKRMSNVSVIIPKSGTSLWADLWAIPAASRFADTNRVGGRVRGPSPLVTQWFEFCLEGARAMPFQQEVVPGALPSAIECGVPIRQYEETSKGSGKPKLDTNLISGAPPPEILDRCEFLEPLSENALAVYQWLLATSIQNPSQGFMHRMQHSILSAVQSLWSKMKMQPKVF